MVPSIFHARFPFKEAAVGEVRRGRVSIWRHTFMNSELKPVFIGSFQEKSGQVVLAGAFTMRFFSKAGVTLVFGCIVLMVVLIAIAAANGDGSTLVFAAIELAIITFVSGLGCLGQWLSGDDVAWLSTAIRLALSKNADDLEEPR
jgi:hypothetical protein